MGDTIRVLVLEDDEDYVALVRLCLEEPDDMGLVFELDPAESLAEARRKLSSGSYDAALVDLGLPDARELEAVKVLLAAAPRLPLLVSTGSGGESVALEAMRLGVQDFMVKGSSDSRLLKRAIRYAIERKALEFQRAELAELRHLDKLKDQWIGTLSHDLRSPLTVISAAVAELNSGKAGPLSATQQMLVGLAHRQADRLVNMVVHLLDLLRLESGTVKADLRSIDAAEVVRRVVEDFTFAASERAVRLEADLPQERLAGIVDPNLFEQLVVNLVDNSLRFARERVVVRLSSDGNDLHLTVRDDGIGIPPEKHAALFTRYSQLDRSKKEGYKGTGLGLAICKEISAMHGGTIGIKSADGGGTAFIVRLPIAGPTRTPPPYAAASRRA